MEIRTFDGKVSCDGSGVSFFRADQTVVGLFDQRTSFQKRLKCESILVHDSATWIGRLYANDAGLLELRHLNRLHAGPWLCGGPSPDADAITMIAAGPEAQSWLERLLFHQEPA